MELKADGFWKGLVVTLWSACGDNAIRILTKCE